jgi:flagellin
LDNIASQTNYNGRQLISSSNALSAANTHTFQLGEKSSDSISTTAIHANTSGLPQSLSNVYEITETLGINGSLGFNNSDSNFNVTMTGNVEVDLTGEGGVFKNSGSGNITITVSSGGYEEMVLQTLTTGSFTDGGGGTFTLAPGGTIELVDSGINQPMSFSNMKITMNSSLTVTSGDFTSIVNNTGSLLLGGSATKASVGPTPLLLSDLKNLGTLTETNAKSYQQVVDDSITQLNKYRSDIGSTQNQVQSAVRNLMTQATNLEAAKSTIIDVDYASESASFNKEMIILSAGQFSLTQANTYQSSILSLLQ